MYFYIFSQHFLIFSFALGSVLRDLSTEKNIEYDSSTHINEAIEVSKNVASTLSSSKGSTKEGTKLEKVQENKIAEIPVVLYPVEAVIVSKDGLSETPDNFRFGRNQSKSNEAEEIAEEHLLNKNISGKNTLLPILGIENLTTDLQLKFEDSKKNPSEKNSQGNLTNLSGTSGLVPSKFHQIDANFSKSSIIHDKQSISNETAIEESKNLNSTDNDFIETAFEELLDFVSSSSCSSDDIENCTNTRFQSSEDENEIKNQEMEQITRSSFPDEPNLITESKISEFSESNSRDEANAVNSSFQVLRENSDGEILDSTSNLLLSGHDSPFMADFEDHTDLLVFLPQEDLTHANEMQPTAVSPNHKEDKIIHTFTTQSANLTELVKTPECPPPGMCIFWFLAQDTCAENSHCLGSRICCKKRCSKTCIDI